MFKNLLNKAITWGVLFRRQSDSFYLVGGKIGGNFSPLLLLFFDSSKLRESNFGFSKILIASTKLEEVPQELHILPFRTVPNSITICY